MFAKYDGGRNSLDAIAMAAATTPEAFKSLRRLLIGGGTEGGEEGERHAMETAAGCSL